MVEEEQLLGQNLNQTNPNRLTINDLREEDDGN